MHENETAARTLPKPVERRITAGKRMQHFGSGRRGIASAPIKTGNAASKGQILRIDAVKHRMLGATPNLQGPQPPSVDRDEHLQLWQKRIGKMTVKNENAAGIEKSDELPVACRQRTLIGMRRNKDRTKGLQIEFRQIVDAPGNDSACRRLQRKRHRPLPERPQEKYRLHQAAAFWSSVGRLNTGIAVDSPISGKRRRFTGKR